MAKSVLVVIREDPSAGHRAAEALRIALGLSTGSYELSIILLENARLLLSQDLGDLEEIEILEKHLPVLKELEIPFYLPLHSSQTFQLDTGFLITEESHDSLTHRMARADAVLVF
jgi:sulfur relay (sulfurtransferase) DsrF/TusC family protein